MEIEFMPEKRKPPSSKWNLIFKPIGRQSSDSAKLQKDLSKLLADNPRIKGAFYAGLQDLLKHEMLYALKRESYLSGNPFKGFRVHPYQIEHSFLNGLGVWERQKVLRLIEKYQEKRFATALGSLAGQWNYCGYNSLSQSQSESLR
ncbi:MAG: hypothetical protein KGH61_04415 [Candidatus Micrarchaeota archaeon]|nr:hypothetical protein [Candidatus Micrarchaeota archaeon]MDE1848162.1 hypothetical protein [Candidatus Micrarchaeota archaeon]MDE1864650.1 hypothetical protein [Candidatus Micrarchaeota archaeon]